MTYIQNLLAITVISAITIFYLYFLLQHKEVVAQEEEENPYAMDYLIRCVKESLNQVLNKNMAELNLKRSEFEKREQLRQRLKRALRTCSYGNVGEKEYVKDYISELLECQLGINEQTIDLVLPFEQTNYVTIQDQFEIVLYLYKKRYGTYAFQKMVEAYGLAKGKQKEDGLYYEIDDEDIGHIFYHEYAPLSYPDKLKILAQRIYQMYKGHGVIDELRDMRIDGISGGVSGDITITYNYMEEMLKKRPSHMRGTYNSIWVFYQGKSIHLKFLDFQSQSELERVCKNIYRYNHPGQLSAVNGYKVNDLYDGARVVVVRPPFAESWAFFIRKFDTVTKVSMEQLITDQNANLPIQLIRWLMKGCEMVGITGEQGCGKTTLLKAMVKFIDTSYTLRIQELIFETHLRNIYPDRNIITFRETEHVSGQEALDLQKKTDGVVNILGEVASAQVAAWVVQLSQVGTKMTMFTNHAMTTEKMVEYFRNALLSTNLFRDEKIAQEQVVDAIHFDIHMVKDREGHRYIERISEIVPKRYRKGKNARNKDEMLHQYLYAKLEDKQYEVVDLVVYEEGEYRIKNCISEEKFKNMMRNLTKEEQQEFRKYQDDMKHRMIMEQEKEWEQSEVEHKIAWEEIEEGIEGELV